MYISEKIRLVDMIITNNKRILDTVLVKQFVKTEGR